MKNTIARTAGVLAFLTAAASSVLLAAPATAADYGSQSWTVTSDIGVKTRDAARQEAVVGYGPAAGEQLQDLCQILTDSAVGEYGNRLWHLMARADGRRTWVNDHWLDSPNKANELTPGTPVCAGSEGLDPGVEQPAAAAAGSGWQKNCDPANIYIGGHIEVRHTDYNGLMITIPVTDEARHPASGVTRREVTNSIWHAVQDCVPGLEGQLADNVYWQISCHEEWSYPGVGDFWATGPTFDIEGWKKPVGGGRLNELAHRCGDDQP